MRGHPWKTIRARKDFQSINRNGRVQRGKFLNLWYRAGEDGPARMAIVVSKRVSPKATKRNLWKRRIRESLKEENLGRGLWMLVKVRQSGEVPALTEIQKELTGLIRQAGKQEKKKAGT